MFNTTLFIILLVLVLLPDRLAHKNISGYELVAHKKEFNTVFIGQAERISQKKRLYTHKTLHWNGTVKMKIPEKKRHMPAAFFSGNRLSRGPEDPRFISIGSSSYILYNDVYEDKTAMFLYNLTTQMETKLQYSQANSVEKNWSPFVHNNQLYVSYFIDPHIVLKVDVESGMCEKVVENPQVGSLKICGGTPAIYIEQLNAYLGIGHVYTSGALKWFRNYYCVAYIFEAEYPFNMRHVGALFRFFRHTTFIRSRIEFPVGLELQGNSLLISVGVDDIHSFHLRCSADDFIREVVYDGI